MDFNVRWSDNTPDLARNLALGLTQVQATQQSVDKLVTSLSGDTQIKAADRWAQALQKLGGEAGALGGIQKLTATETDRATAAIEKALSKYQALGVEAPKALQDIAAALQAVGAKSDESGQKLSAFAAHLEELKPKTDSAHAAFTSLHGTLSEMWENPTAAVGKLSGAIATDLSGSLGTAGVVAGGVAAAFVAAGVAAFELAEHAAQVGGELENLHLKTGMSVEGLSKLSYAAQVAGGSVDQIASAMFMFEKQAGNDAPKVAAGMELIGLRLEDIKQLAPEDQFTAIATALSKTEDATTRNAAGADIFGRSFRDLAPLVMKLNDALELTKDITPWTAEQAKQAEEFEMHLASIRVHFDAIATNLGREVLPSVDKFVSALDTMSHWEPSQWMKLLLTSGIGPGSMGIIPLDQEHQAPVLLNRGGVPRDTGMAGVTLPPRPGIDPSIVGADEKEVEKILDALTKANEAAAKKYAAEWQRNEDEILKLHGEALIAEQQIDKNSLASQLNVLEQKRVNEQQSWATRIAESTKSADELNRGAAQINRKYDALEHDAELTAVRKIEDDKKAINFAAITQDGELQMKASQKGFELDAKRLTQAETINAEIQTLRDKAAAVRDQTDLTGLALANAKVDQAAQHEKDVLTQRAVTNVELAKRLNEALAAVDDAAEAQRAHNDEEAGRKKSALLLTLGLEDQRVLNRLHGLTLAAALQENAQELQAYLAKLQAEGRLDQDAVVAAERLYHDKGEVIKNSFSQLANELGGFASVFSTLGQQAANSFVGPILAGFGQLFSGISKYEQAVKQFGADSPQANSAKWQTYGAIAGAVAQNINTGAGASTTALVAQGAASGASAGSVGGGWGMLGGAVAGGLLGWYQSGVEWRKAIGDVSRDFGGLKIPEDFAKSIEEIESTTGLDRIRALTTQLAKMIEIAGGLNADNFTLFFNKLHDAFSYLQNNTMTIAQVSQTVDSVFEEFARVGTDAYGRINDQVRELIDLDAHYQTQSKAIAAWMQGQAASLATGLNDLLTQPLLVSAAATGKAVADAQKAYDDLKSAGKASASDLQKAYDALTAALTTQHQEAERNTQALTDFGTTAVTAFNAAIASGATFIDALKAIGPALDTIRQAYKDLGVAIDDATLKGLVLENTILNGTKDAPSSLGKAISGLQAIITAATNLGTAVETHGAFTAQQGSLASLYTQTQAASANAGVTGAAGTAASLLPFQQTLHQLQDWAKAHNEQLDENTQRMIDQSVELGVWTDDLRTDGEKTRDSIANLITSNDAIAKALGGLPQALADVIAGRPPSHPNPPETTDPGARPPAGMASGGFGFASGPMAFTTQGNEQYAFSGEGKSFSDGALGFLAGDDPGGGFAFGGNGPYPVVDGLGKGDPTTPPVFGPGPGSGPVYHLTIQGWNGTDILRTVRSPEFAEALVSATAQNKSGLYTGMRGALGVS